MFEELQAQDRAVTKVEERKLSPQERELMRKLEKKRQRNISKKLNEIYKDEEFEYWHKDVISQPNIFKGGDSLLKQPHLFSGGKVL